MNQKNTITKCKHSDIHAKQFRIRVTQVVCLCLNVLFVIFGSGQLYQHHDDLLVSFQQMNSDYQIVLSNVSSDSVGAGHEEWSKLTIQSMEKPVVDGNALQSTALIKNVEIESETEENITSEQDFIEFNAVSKTESNVEEKKSDVVSKPVITESSEETSVFTIPDGTYNYCPSVISSNGVTGMFYCSNTKLYKVIDNICYSDFSYGTNGSIVLKNRYTILKPTAGSWDSVHVCDPSVVSGNFSYQGSSYQYLMTYLGCDTTDCQKNQIGIAVSNSLTGGWIKIQANPIIQHHYDSSKSGFQWGVGQPSIMNLDGNGRVVIFYTEGTYNKTCTKAQEWDLSNLDAPQLLKSSDVTNVGTGDFISNADFALSGNTLTMICDKHPFGGNLLNCVADASCVYTCTWDGNVESLSSVSWTRMFTVDSHATGFAKNHNCGLFRDLKGNLAKQSVMYTAASEKSDFLNSLCTYRLCSISY